MIYTLFDWILQKKHFCIKRQKIALRSVCLYYPFVIDVDGTMTYLILLCRIFQMPTAEWQLTTANWSRFGCLLVPIDASSMRSLKILICQLSKMIANSWFLLMPIFVEDMFEEAVSILWTMFRKWDNKEDLLLIIIFQYLIYFCWMDVGLLMSGVGCVVYYLSIP